MPTEQEKEAAMDEAYKTWKYFGLPVLVLGLSAIIAWVFLDRAGFIAWEPYGIIRLDDEENRIALRNALHIDEATASSRLLKSITSNGVQVSLDIKGYLQLNTAGNFESSLQVHLGDLDQMMFAESLSNSARSKDRWSIVVFCQDQQTCIHKSFENRDRIQKSSTISYAPLFSISGEDNARQSLSLLHRLVQEHGGKAALKSGTSASYLKHSYQN